MINSFLVYISVAMSSSEFFYSTSGPVGSIPELPAYSCEEIKASRGGQVVSGNYWLDLEKNGNPLKVYCDMTTDGGK